MEKRKKMNIGDLMAVASTLWQANLSRKETRKELKRLIAIYRADNPRPRRIRVKTQQQSFVIYWAIMGPQSPVPMPMLDGQILYYRLEEDISFPVYISGKQLENFNICSFESMELNLLNMVAGALLGCLPPRPHIPTQGPYDLRPLLNDYLKRYSSSLGYEKLEDLILEVAQTIRKLNGYGASAQVLKNSECLDVDFNKILKDLLLDLWVMLGTTEEDELPRAFQEFRGYLSEVSLEEMELESITRYNFARTVTLLFFGVSWPGSVRQSEWAEAVASNKNPRMRERLECLWQEKRFDRSLL